MQRAKSRMLIERARRTMPGGVNSPVRAFKGVGGDPAFFHSGEGAWLEDVDGNRCIDYVCSWGPVILGHRNAKVVAAIKAQADLALGFGAPTELEIDLAERIVSMVPSVEKVRLVNSGTEAAMTAIRLARGFTGRDLIVKFEGCYHGHSDSLLTKAGSGLLTLGIPNSPGVPAAVAAQTLTLPFNDAEAVRKAYEAHPQRIAGLILEPVAGNMGCIPPQPGFLEAIRQITRADGSLLIFDEVMTGFRVARGGAQARYGVMPDLTALGKIIGGGLPVGALGGRREVMDRLAPEGDVYQAGTLSGNPLAVAAGIATLDALDEEVYAALEASTNFLTQELKALAVKHGRRVAVNQVCGMFSLFFDAPAPVTAFEQVANANSDAYARFFHAMLHQGVYLAPSAFEVGFIGVQHTRDLIDATLAAADAALAAI